MSDYPEQVQNVGVIGPGFQKLLVKPACLRQMPGTMVIQRQPEQIVFMLGQGLSINPFDMNRKPVGSGSTPCYADHGFGNYATRGLGAVRFLLRNPLSTSKPVLLGQ